METAATAAQAQKKKQKILVIKTGEPVPKVAETRGQFADLIIRSIGDAFRGEYAVIDPRTEALPTGPVDDAVVVITGSAANVPHREPWMIRTEAWLRDVVAAGTPTFGICFGHQILAQALGGEVQKNPRGREIGTLLVERTIHDSIFDGLPDSFEANVTHIDSVVRLPEGATSLARSSLEDHHAIRFSETCYGVQFHPEIDAEVMRGYIDSRREILLSEGFDVDAMISRLGEGEPGRQTLRNFIRRFTADI
ncbi:MAG: glutamine amidotransferase [Minicystis sp.]